VEFPARTVVHLVLGMLIGVLLVIKIAIVRFFKHLEGTLIPFLGTLVLICTVLVLGLSVPFSLRYVTAYLIAISPDLQQGVSNQRDQEQSHAVAKEIAKNVSTGGTPLEEFSLADSRKVFEVSCMQCHASSLVERHPPRTQKQAEELVNRMVDNGLDLSEADLRKIVFYLKTTYAK
jgi:cytochrome c5